MRNLTHNEPLLTDPLVASRRPSTLTVTLVTTHSGTQQWSVLSKRESSIDDGLHDFVRPHIAQITLFSCINALGRKVSSPVQQQVNLDLCKCRIRGYLFYAAIVDMRLCRPCPISRSMRLTFRVSEWFILRLSRRSLLEPSFAHNRVADRPMVALDGFVWWSCLNLTENHYRSS